MHVHLFIVPKAGRTPIDFDAANVSITHVVLSGQGYGVYGGGGFLLPGDDPGDPVLAGRIRAATLRPLAHTEGFIDRLGHTEVEGRVRAELNRKQADAVAAWLSALTQSRLASTP
ncbi:MAG: hypothetical protein IBJ11_11010 [Phycisphaerales bacterium]|nr:hypothetical protein [Phycisphaerales bacterium]